MNKGKVVLAEDTVSRTRDGQQRRLLSVYLYNTLVKSGFFRLAQEYYFRARLDDDGVVNVVSQHEIHMEDEANRLKYVSIPEGSNGQSIPITVVDTKQTAHFALSALGLVADPDCKFKCRVDPLVWSATNDGIQRTMCIGVDVEWSYKGKNEAHILQIATKNHILLFDLYSFRKNKLDGAGDSAVAFRLIYNMLKYIFAHECYCKVAWAFNNADRDMLSRAGNGKFCGCFSDIKNVLQLELVTGDLYKRIPKSHWDSLMSKNSRIKFPSSSLTAAAELFLGKPLNKSEQLSDWCARPLSYSQLQYAAIDAHCLLAIRDCASIYQHVLHKLGVKGYCENMEQSVSEVTEQIGSNANCAEYYLGAHYVDAIYGQFKFNDKNLINLDSQQSAMVRMPPRLEAPVLYSKIWSKYVLNVTAPNVQENTKFRD